MTHIYHQIHFLNKSFLYLFHNFNLIIMMMMMMIWYFKSVSTVFKSYQDHGRVIMKGSVQWSAMPAMSWILPLMKIKFRISWCNVRSCHSDTSHWADALLTLVNRTFLLRNITYLSGHFYLKLGYKCKSWHGSS